MKNLKICDISVNRLNFNSEKVRIACQSSDEHSHLFTCSDNLTVTNFSNNGDVCWARSIAEHENEDSRPVNQAQLALGGTVSVALVNGTLWEVTSDGASQTGRCNTRLQAMEWSPDQELLVLITEDQKMMLMSYTYDLVNEVCLSDNEFGEGQFITVGWGKKETQFHGSEGKQAAKAKVEVASDPKATNFDAKITWRGDGQLFAVGFSIDGIRRFKVFDREGHLQFTSEIQPGLEHNLAWRPSGNLIATTQKLPNKYVVAFFEKNGLKHGEFTIPVNETTTVEEISWNTDSEILTLQCKDMSKEEQKILLYTISNYHWYLKQSISFNAQQKIVKTFWDKDFDVTKNKKLHVILEDGGYYTYSWIWNIDHSTGKTDFDDAIVGVIDGPKILLTGFRQTVVPPPMAALELDVGANINQISFFKDTDEDCHIDSNSFLVVTEKSELHFYRQINKFPLQYELISAGHYKTENMVKNYDWIWMTKNCLVCIEHCDGVYNILEFIVDVKQKSCLINQTHSVTLPDSTLGSQVHPMDKSKLYVLLNCGEIIEYTFGGQINPIDQNLPTACSKFSVLLLDEELFFIGLSQKGGLYINDTLAVTNISSYFLHPHFLLLTTQQHFLLCTEATKTGLNAIINYQKLESPQVYKRQIERGARLVIVVPSDTRAVFQMPRGNLEVIQPRPLSLRIIGEYLDQLKYHKAFDLMRKQRINLNLICDHNPDKFRNNVDVFLESIKNNSWLSLFLSDLENVDVTRTMYPSSYSKLGALTNGEQEGKVTFICDIIRERLLQRDDHADRVLPLLTTFVKNNTIEDLERALSVIKDLRKQESEGIKKPVGSEEALKYLLYMVDVNNLFDVALGMYDFDLVLFVASKSQKDPKDYVTMLNELYEMDENFKQFSINKHLKRFERAVQCLARCGPDKHDELRSFVKYHSLYREALQIFSPTEDIYKMVAEDFASYLSLKMQFVEAGVMYKRAGNVEEAVACFKEALEWELAIELAYGCPAEDFEKLCYDLVSSLRAKRRHKEALTILEQYTSDYERTIMFAVDCGLYKTALRLCKQYCRADLKEETLVPTMLVEVNKLKELLTASEATFIRHKNRLLAVREEKKRSQDMVDPSFGNRDSDLYSDAGSTVGSSSSRGSSGSHRSGKNRRKLERKLASLKEGSPHEEAALILALHALVRAVVDLRGSCGELGGALLAEGRGQREAEHTQNSLDRILKLMKDSFRDIWTDELLIEATRAATEAATADMLPQGIAALEPHMRIAPVIRDFSWKLDGLC